MAFDKFTAFILIVSIQVFSTKALDGGKCKGMDVKLTEEEIMHIKDCAVSVGIKSAESITPEQIACITKCVLLKKGVMDIKAGVHKENISKFVEASMPDVVKEDLKVAIEKCVNENGPKVKPDEPSCISYTPLSDCMHNAFKNLCA